MDEGAAGVEVLVTSPAPGDVTATDSAHQFIHLGRRKALLYHRRRIGDALILAVGEGLALLAALGLAYHLDLWLTGAASWPVWAWGFPVLWWGIAAFSRLLPGWGLGAAEELRRMTLGLVTLFVGTAALLFLAKQAETGRMLLAMGGPLALVMLPATRAFIKYILVRLNKWGVPVVIYGCNGTVKELCAALRNERAIGYNPVGIFHGSPELWGEKIWGIPVLGGLNQNTDEVPVALLIGEGLNKKLLEKLLDGPLSLYRRVIFIPSLPDSLPILGVRSCGLAGRPAFEINRELTDPVAQVIKRLFDLVFVVGTLPLWAPLIAIIALLIWLSDRKAPFFMHQRIGYKGRPIRVIKFRTMVPNAQEVLETYLEQHPEARKEWEENFKLKNDPRVTRIGKWLRKFSLDELPQLWNVLRGELSLVGPRPIVEEEARKYGDKFDLYLRVKPGVTGIWQVSGRNDTSYEYRVMLDSFYVRNWSIWLDLVILIRTIRVVLQGHGAY
ncbi:undecaprenyl-phosphate galactose phosphotransferase WbaP [Rhodothermus profundi]|nr:undecaprenyl-phosphate galactose phosphotransferase WbaP [Rhodothermus profundi]